MAHAIPNMGAWTEGFLEGGRLVGDERLILSLDHANNSVIGGITWTLSWNHMDPVMESHGTLCGRVMWTVRLLRN